MNKKQFFTSLITCVLQYYKYNNTITILCITNENNLLLALCLRICTKQKLLLTNISKYVENSFLRTMKFDPQYPDYFIS